MTTSAPNPLLAVLVAVWTIPTALAGQTIKFPDSLPPGVTRAMVERGSVVFEQDGVCSTCHGAHADGTIGPDLTDGDWWHAKGSYLEIMRQILIGVPAGFSVRGVAMPPRGGSSISDADVQAVAAYVWSLSHPEAGDSLPAGVTPSMVQRGDQVFHGAGKCATCHGADARGNVGPDLTDDNWLHAKGSYLSIVSQILNGVPAERSRRGIAMSPRGGAAISDDDVHAVAAYVWVLNRIPH